MKLVLRCCFLALAFLFTQLAFAQGTVNLAVVAELNVTLNDNCQALIIPEELLTGDFDEDGDGIDVPFSAFTVVVEDGNEENGNVLDGCGTFLVRITANELVLGFTTAWATINAEDKTSPIITELPEAPEGPLYCFDLADVSITMLDNEISRCYRYNTRTNTVLPGTLNPALEDRLLAGGGLPVVTDNCSEEVEICVNDILTTDPESPECNDVILTRTFTATDGACQNAPGEANDPAVASYDIVFLRPSLADVNTDNVPASVAIECTDPRAAGLNPGEIPAPSEDDLPFIPGPDGTNIPLVIGDGSDLCNIGLTYEDSAPLFTCDQSWKIVRTYTIIDWCNPNEVETVTQTVKVGDFTAPTFTAPTQDRNFDGIVDDGPLVFQTNAGNVCGAYIRLDQPSITLTDACSDDISLKADVYPFGDLDGAPIGTFNLNLNDIAPEIGGPFPAGDHIIRYTYTDECGNFESTDVDITIVDRTAPVARCEDGLNVTLTSGSAPDGTLTGSAVITPEMIDGGTTDDCSDVSLSIGRVRQLEDGTYQLLPGATYGPELRLTCEDLGDVLVGLRAEDEEGNVNYCWLSILVEDKLRPTCLAPAPVTITCSQYTETLPADITEASNEELNAAFGTPTGLDNCEVNVLQFVHGDVNSCGVGQITRTFRVVDGQGLTNVEPCSQIIDVIGVHEYTIIFPGDEDVICRMEPSVGQIEVIESDCDLITAEITVDTFQSQVDECYKLEITHRVINWCEYNTFGQPYLIPRDYDQDNNIYERTFLYIDPQDIYKRGDDIAYLDNDNNRLNNGFRRLLDDGDDNDGTNDNNGDDNIDNNPYGTDFSRGAFDYVQFVRIFDEVPPQIVTSDLEECFEALSINCTGDVTLQFELTDDCTAPDQVRARIELDQDYDGLEFVRSRFLLDTEFSDNDEGDFTVLLENVPVGTHAIRIQGADGCGNYDVEVIEFCVEDAKAPTPICIPQLTVTLMPNGDGTGMAAIWATDYVASPVDDCSGDVTYSIYTAIEAGEPGFTPAPGRDGIILDCDSDQTVPVRVYAFDPTGLGDYCSAFVLVQRAENACVSDATGSISGAIISENGNTVGGVSLLLSGATESRTDVSGVDGTYNFENLQVGEDYTIDAVFDSYINHSQGVSTLDLVLITRYILGLDELHSPYQRLAADANNDKEISVQDIISIRRLILGLDDSYQANSAYRFVDASFIFPVPTNPWATNFPEVVNENNLSASVRDADFIAIMIGDVNGNGFNNFNSGSNARPRTGAVDLELPNQLLKTGETYEIPLLAGAASSLVGLQTTLEAKNGLEILDVVPGQVGGGLMNLRQLERGRFAFSYNNEAGLGDGAPVLSLRVKATTDMLLSDGLTLSDGMVFSEGYNTAGLTVGLALNFVGTEEVLAVNRLLQNIPNPVREQTTIRFELIKDGVVSLSVLDMTGKLVLTREIAGAAGANQVVLDRAALGAAGVLTYTLTGDDFSLSRKMVVQ
ncbi:T9SS type A sorting domain-containing protein [Lewinella sp. W8]|uniref:T9SS type A sorting domain-containing protein n=1 Tax=Lewinella sp. W8 TaxID=2528208 RepID=UPI0010672E19|nr:T9SS type A sorting domain-containing protein [Lewinella sp. W8]MTB51611.1 T9SS type A sorting domain-containing protein [Lewinella sp. W8]